MGDDSTLSGFKIFERACVFKPDSIALFFLAFVILKMEHIPIELLHEIFIKLDLKDRLECMLVCRLFYNALDQGSLLCTLRINSRVFLKFKEMIKRQPYRATQVKKNKAICI